jgi:hypothetical protein
MLEVASKYGKDVHQIHKLFYGVSCNYDRLIKFLDTEKRDIKTIAPDQLQKHKEDKKLCKPWETLEDLALKGSKDTDAYKYVIDNRSADDIAERRRFLELKD